MTPFISVDQEGHYFIVFAISHCRVAEKWLAASERARYSALIAFSWWEKEATHYSL